MLNIPDGIKCPTSKCLPGEQQDMIKVSYFMHIHMYTLIPGFHQATRADGKRA